MQTCIETFCLGRLTKIMADEGLAVNNGRFLREARTARGVSLEQVTRDIHISKGILAALELGDYSDMPGEAYVAGFIRSYATYLEIDPEPLVDNYRRDWTPKVVANLPRKSRRSLLVKVVMLTLLVVAVGFGVSQLVRTLM